MIETSNWNAWRSCQDMDDREMELPELCVCVCVTESNCKGALPNSVGDNGGFTSDSAYRREAHRAGQKAS